MRPAPGVQVHQDFRVEPSPVDVEKHPELTPIVINNFNRLDCLRRLLTALSSRGYENVYIIDNNSTYEPLLQFYSDSGVRVFRLNRNVGWLSMWTTSVGAIFGRGYYVYTDPDVEPIAECPDDFIAHFRDALSRYPWVDKVGFGLEIDDLPETLRAAVRGDRARASVLRVSGGARSLQGRNRLDARTLPSRCSGRVLGPQLANWEAVPRAAPSVVQRLVPP